MSLVLAGTADSITYVLDAAPATNQLPASIYYALQGGSGNQANTLSNGTTPVTILAGSVTAAIVINSLVIPNRDTATRTVTVNMVTGAGTFEQVQVILASGSHLNYSSGNGWYVMDKNGNFLETVTVTGGTSTVNQGTANTLANAWPVEVTDGTNILGTSAHPIRTDTTGTTIQPVSGTVTVNAGTGNLGVNLTQLNSVAIGSPSNYGTSPGAVSVQGVNAFITNVPAVSQSGSWTVTLGAGAATIGAVNQGTSPWAVSLTSTTITGTVAVTQSTSPWVVSLTSTTITGTVAVTQSTTPWTIQGDSASGAANAGNPVKVGGVFNTTQPTVTNGQTVDAQNTARGARIVATGVDAFTVAQGGAPWSFNLTQVAGSAIALGQTTKSASLPVVLASDYQAGAANALTSFLNNSSTSFTFGSTATRFLQSITITTFSVVSTTNTTVTIKDPAGNTIYTAIILVMATSTVLVNYVQLSGLAIPMAAGGSSPIASMTPTFTTGGTLVVSLGFT